MIWGTQTDMTLNPTTNLLNVLSFLISKMGLMMLPNMTLIHRFNTWHLSSILLLYVSSQDGWLRTIQPVRLWTHF